MSHTPTAGNPERERVLTMAVVRAAEKLGISGKDLATILGVAESTVSRMRKDEFRLREGSKPFDTGVQFIDMFRSLYAITNGDYKVASSWLRNYNLALVGRPIEQIKRLSGLKHATGYIDSRLGRI